MMSPQTEVIQAADKGYGKKYSHDPQFHGPQLKRGCTDVICLLLFFVFLIAFGFAGYYAYREGDLNRLLVPRDTDGYQCGQDSEVVDKKFLVFFDLAKCADPLVPLNGCPTPQTCVAECPTTNFQHSLENCQRESNFENYKKKLICTRSVKLSDMKNCNDVDRHVETEHCAKWYLKSTPLSNRCFPSDTNDFVDIIERSDLIQGVYNIQLFGAVNGMGQLIVEDTINTWPVLAVGFVGAALCSLIIIAVMRWVAGPIVWLSVIGVIALLSVGTYFSYMKYDYFKKNPVDRFNLQLNLKSYIDSLFVEANTWLYILIATSVVLVVILLFVIVFRKRIVIAIALIKEGSKAVSSNLTTVLFPIFPWLFQAAVIFGSVLMFLNLASVGEPMYKVTGMKNATASCVCNGNYTAIKDSDSCYPETFNELCTPRMPNMPCAASCVYIGIQTPPMAQYFKAVIVIGLIWLLCFISAFAEMVLAGTFSQWYWTMRKENVPFFTLTGAIYRTFRFHLGTLAFGSLIITICRIIRLVLEYINMKLKKYDNELTKAILCCCRCFFWMLENFLKFLNRNAYIMCAVHGENFFSSAKEAFNLLMRNVLRVVALDKTTDFLFFLSKLMISLGVSACTYMYLTSQMFEEHFPNVLVHYPLAQIVFIFILTYFIASVFFGVYSMAVDTLFLCFLEDCERNDGSPDRPYFMSKQLMKILNKTNK